MRAFRERYPKVEHAKERRDTRHSLVVYSIVMPLIFGLTQESIRFKLWTVHEGNE
jgi:hypothetical protein